MAKTRHRLSKHFVVEEFDCKDGTKVSSICVVSSLSRCAPSMGPARSTRASAPFVTMPTSEANGTATISTQCTTVTIRLPTFRSLGALRPSGMPRQTRSAVRNVVVAVGSGCIALLSTSISATSRPTGEADARRTARRRSRRGRSDCDRA